jgi:amidohydrolase
MNISPDVRSSHKEMVALRRAIHQYPEEGFKEFRTAALVRSKLKSWGVDHRTMCGTGTVALIKGSRPGPTMLIRADMDALPLTEENKIPYCSRNKGVMHACGHDGHTAIGITLAEILAARRRDVPGTAVFIFQPAEEIFGGAQPMIEAGVLERPRVDEIYGLHLTTQTAVGRVTVRPGPSMASADFFDVEVTGQGGHGAYPHLSHDPITAAANILVGMQNLVSREVAAQETAVLTIGQFVGGTKHNIIPASAVLRGSLRTFNPRVRAQIKERLAAYAGHVAQAYRTEARLSWMADGCPTVVNHEKETDFVRRCAMDALSPDAVSDGDQVMASDDMSLFLQERPGCYFRVGIAPTDGRPHPHHAPEFEMNESGLAVGVQVGLAVMLDALRG